MEGWPPTTGKPPHTSWTLTDPYHPMNPRRTTPEDDTPPNKEPLQQNLLQQKDAALPYQEPLQ